MKGNRGMTGADVIEDGQIGACTGITGSDYGSIARRLYVLQIETAEARTRTGICISELQAINGARV